MCGYGERSKPIRFPDNLKVMEGSMDTQTIQKLSYPPYCPVPRTAPIKPAGNHLKFDGCLYGLTSMKHDFCPKNYSKRFPYKPMDNFFKDREPLEKCTVNMMSYMPFDVCTNPPPKPIKPPNNVVHPSGPSEKCTIQKLSYMPVPIPPKENYPWARIVRIIPPKYSPQCTTYNLSYMPNCNEERTRPIAQPGAIKMFRDCRMDPNTVYKLSYMNSANAGRTHPIKPLGTLTLPNVAMDKCTTYKVCMYWLLLKPYKLPNLANTFKSVGHIFRIQTKFFLFCS